MASNPCEVVKKWCLYSGGKDSATAAHVLDKRGELAGVVALETGISTPDWRAFVTEEAEQQGWDLVFAKTPVLYRDLVLKYGFPGYDMHRVMFSALKGRAVREFKKAHPGAVLASGVRRRESGRRKRNTSIPADWEGLPVVRPILDWSTERVWTYLKDNGLRRSPAYATLGISGDCLCGAYATPTEKTLIEVFYPPTAKLLRELEVDVFAAGWKNGWGWGNGLGNGFDAATQQSQLEAYACGSCATGDEV